MKRITRGLRGLFVDDPTLLLEKCGGRRSDGFNADSSRGESGLGNVAPNAFVAHWLQQVTPHRGRAVDQYGDTIGFSVAVTRPESKAALLELSNTLRAPVVGSDPLQACLVAGGFEYISHWESLPLDCSSEGPDSAVAAPFAGEFSSSGLFTISFWLESRPVALGALNMNQLLVFDAHLGTVQCNAPQNLAQCATVLAKWNARKSGFSTIPRVRLTRYQRKVEAVSLFPGQPLDLGTLVQASGGQVIDGPPPSAPANLLESAPSNALVAHWSMQVATRGTAINLPSTVNSPATRAKLASLSASFRADALAGRQPFQAYLGEAGLVRQSSVETRPLADEFYRSNDGRDLAFEALLAREFGRPGLFLLMLRGVWLADRAVMLAVSTTGPLLAFDPSLGTIQCASPQILTRCVASLVKWNTRNKVGFNTLKSLQITRYGR